ncbi:MAG: OsmC family protein [Gammaproteobacteria bacterium]|nr:OsmC family protein [Gammaproteobacteria bacterium]
MAIRQKNSVVLSVSAQCPSHSLSHIKVRDIGFDIDEPVERGGSNKGPTPTDTVLAALAGCTNVIGHKCASKLGIDIGELDVAVKCEFDRRGVMLSEDIDIPFTHISLEVKCSGSASNDELQVVAAEVSKYCPVSKLFRQAGTQVEEIWTKA